MSDLDDRSQICFAQIYRCVDVTGHASESSLRARASASDGHSLRPHCPTAQGSKCAKNQKRAGVKPFVENREGLKPYMGQ